MPIINFVNEKKQIEVEAGENLRKAALKAGVELYSGPHKVVNCMGFLICGGCNVLVKKGKENVSEMGICEKLRLNGNFDYIGQEDEMRLACQTQVNGDIEVNTKPEMNWFGENFFS